MYLLLTVFITILNHPSYFILSLKRIHSITLWLIFSYSHTVINIVVNLIKATLFSKDNFFASITIFQYVWDFLLVYLILCLLVSLWLVFYDIFLQITWPICQIVILIWQTHVKGVVWENIFVLLENKNIFYYFTTAYLVNFTKFK